MLSELWTSTSPPSHGKVKSILPSITVNDCDPDSMACYSDYFVYHKTCAEVRAYDEGAQDTNYTLYFKGDKQKPYNVWCFDMDGEPQEYLWVQNTTNYARYSCGGGLEGIGVMTAFQLLRFNVTSSSIILDDYRYVNQFGNCRLVPVENAKVHDFTHFIRIQTSVSDSVFDLSLFFSAD